MYPGLEEWWLHRGFKPAKRLIYARTVSIESTQYFVYSMWLARLIRANILVLVSEFIVVAIFSEWWSGPTTVGTSLTHECVHINYTCTCTGSHIWDHIL